MSEKEDMQTSGQEGEAMQGTTTTPRFPNRNEQQQLQERSQSLRTFDVTPRPDVNPRRAASLLAADRLERWDSVQSLETIPAAETTRPIPGNGNATSRPLWSSLKNRRGGGSVSGGESQRSVMSNESQRSINSLLEEEEKRRMIEELETLRIAEEAQEEEMIRLALERSLTETSGGHSRQLFNYQDMDVPSPSLERHRKPHASPPSSRHHPVSLAKPALRPCLRSTPVPSTVQSSRSLGEPAEQSRTSLAGGFRRVASERSVSPNQNDFYDLSPRDEPDYRRVLRLVPPPITHLDTSPHRVRPGTAVSVNTPAPMHPLQISTTSSLRAPSSGASSASFRPGFVSISIPAPTVKSPRRRTVESLMSPVIDQLPSAAGTAVNVNSPAPTTKSAQVRAAITAHVTSPLVAFQRSPTESPAQQPHSSFSASSSTRQGPLSDGSAVLPSVPNMARTATSVSATESSAIGMEHQSASIGSIGRTAFQVSDHGEGDAKYLCKRTNNKSPDILSESGGGVRTTALSGAASVSCNFGNPHVIEEVALTHSVESSDPSREAVMQLVKLHLPPFEAHLVEEALRKGAQLQKLDETLSNKGSNIPPCETRSQEDVRSVWQAPPEQPNETHSVDWPTLSEQRQPKTSSSVVATKGVGSSSIPNTFDLSEGRKRNVSDEEQRHIELALCASRATLSTDTNVRRTPPESEYDLAGAGEHLSEEELLRIQQALQGIPESMEGDDNYATSTVVDHMSEEDSEAIVRAVREAEEEETIARALREADEEDERKSFELALKMQKEDEELQYIVPGGSFAARQRLQQRGNVRTMTRAEYAAQGLEHIVGSSRGSAPPIDHPRATEFDADEEYLAAGFRMNSSARQQWSRRDQNSIVGPNREVRTKHDTALQGQANAQRLGLEAEDVARVGNQAYNSFLQSIKGTKKGVSTKGTGRAGSDTDATKGGAMDPRVRSQISRAINNKVIEKCNGVVKEGKEAIVYHADKGEESGGFDVAIKVFKRIQEFRGRGEYVDGDPRYGRSTFRNASNREQLELWAEKEFRNLVRASRAGVPVPAPLLHRQNIVFMRFLGSDGWPAPQLRELELRRGSKRWVTLYAQVIDAVKR
jgi:serine/threonine-protein kinase RIO1